MKKLITASLLLMMTVTLVACSAKVEPEKPSTQEGIAPYKMSESENYILQSFGMADTSQIISFHAPGEALSLSVNVYRLEADEKWENIGGGAISIGADRKPIDLLAGTFTMQLRENYAIDFNINCGGRAAYKTDEILLDSDATTSLKGFLREFQEIKIGKEIPVAIMVYDSGSSMKTFSLQDYFEPSKFDGMDLVQVVTLEFSDK